jgi:hypothetical protein
MESFYDPRTFAYYDGLVRGLTLSYNAVYQGDQKSAPVQAILQVMASIKEQILRKKLCASIAGTRKFSALVDALDRCIDQGGQACHHEFVPKHKYVR